jgi:hypothetical protein
MGTSKPALTSPDPALTKLVSKTDQKVLAIWAADCAERVLPYFEKAFPKDKRPRLAIDAGQAWVRGELKMTEVRKVAFTAHAAAREAQTIAPASAAARAAGQAAGTAHVSGHAIHAATYALKAVQAATHKSKAEAAVAKEREWQYQRLLKLRERIHG